MVAPVRVIGPFPLLPITTLSTADVVLMGWSGNATLAGVAVMTPRLDPLRATARGDAGVLSVIVTVPVEARPDCGVNVTLMVQLVPTARVAGQLLVCANAPALIPIEPIATGTAPLLA